MGPFTLGGVPSPKTILVVDDEVEIGRVLKKVLTLEGYRILVTTSGQSALSLLRKEQVNLILLDLKMPRMGGLEVLKKVRAQKRKGGIPVVMLTAYGSVSSAREAMTLGAVDYLTKPFDLDAVKSAVREALA